MEERAEELRQAGARVLAVAASLTDEAQVRQLIERVLNEYKEIDILVNLARGLACYKPAVEHCLDDWNHELNNNLLSAFLASRAVFPHMRDAGGGAIINFARAGIWDESAVGVRLTSNAAKRSAGMNSLAELTSLGRTFARFCLPRQALWPSRGCECSEEGSHRLRLDATQSPVAKIDLKSGKTDRLRSFVRDLQVLASTPRAFGVPYCQKQLTVLP